MSCPIQSRRQQQQLAPFFFLVILAMGAYLPVIEAMINDASIGAAYTDALRLSAVKFAAQIASGARFAV